MFRISHITKPTKTALLIGAVLLSTPHAPAMADDMDLIQRALNEGNIKGAEKVINDYRDNHVFYGEALIRYALATGDRSYAVNNAPNADIRETIGIVLYRVPKHQVLMAYKILTTP